VRHLADHDDTGPDQAAILDLTEWHDRWRDEQELEPLVEAVRRAWIGYVALNCEVPRAREKIAEVIPLRRSVMRFKGS
jgi:hypothetical protein